MYIVYDEQTGKKLLKKVFFKFISLVIWYMYNCMTTVALARGKLWLLVSLPLNSHPHWPHENYKM